VVPNADPVPTRDPARLARCLSAQLTSPIRWEETSRALVAAGALAVVEVGGAPLLGPLVRQVHRDLPVHLATGPASPLATAHPQPSASPPALAGLAPARGET